MNIDKLCYSDAGFGIILLSFRQKFKITLSQLSFEISVPLAVLEQIELGLQKPNKELLDLLSSFFNEDFLAIFEETPEVRLYCKH